MFFFFFKQKTAYEMRISDWSSDVCSSDLGARRPGEPRRAARAARPRSRGARARSSLDRAGSFLAGSRGGPARPPGPAPLRCRPPARAEAKAAAVRILGHKVRHNEIIRGLHLSAARSEEHTSELQSLMRISYAVFCLNKKRNTR